MLSKILNAIGLQIAHIYRQVGKDSYDIAITLLPNQALDTCIGKMLICERKSGYHYEDTRVELKIVANKIREIWFEQAEVKIYVDNNNVELYYKEQVITYKI